MRISCFADEIAPALAGQLAGMQKWGLRFIEIRGADGKNITEYTLDETQNIFKRLQGAGVQVSCIGSPIGKIDITKDFAPHERLLGHALRQASLLGARYLRMFSFYIPSGADAQDFQDAVFRRTERMLAMARAENVVLLHENEKGIFGDTAERCLALMRAFSCEHYRAAFDFANFVQCGQDTLQAYALLRPYIAYVHVKDALRADGRVAPAGWGDGHVPSLLSALHESGYDGFLSLEPHLAGFAGLSALQREANRPALSLDHETAFRMALDALRAILYQINWREEQ